MCILKIVVLAVLLSPTIYCQTCIPHPDGVPLEKLAANSPIVVEVSPQNNPALTSRKRKTMHNVTADVVGVFPTHNGGLAEDDVITFGPVGKVDNCEVIKVDGSVYLLFLRESDQPGFYWITYNPIKAVKKTIRPIRKVLCNKCLVPPVFKKKSKTYKKHVGDRLVIKCRPKGKPKAAIKWFYNGKELQPKSVKGLKVKTRKRGGSSSIRFSSLKLSNDGDKFMCSASNLASDQAVNFTATLRVLDAPTASCDENCAERFANYCIHGVCCHETDGTARCNCYPNFIGSRCESRDLGIVSSNRNFSEKYQHQQRMIAVLGMCVALLVIVILCTGVYCLFTRKRGNMHRKMLMNGFAKTSETSPMMTSHDNDIDDRFHDEIVNAPVSFRPPNQPEVAARPEEMPLRYPSQGFNVANGNSFQTHSSDISSAAAVLDEPHYPNVSHPRASVTSLNGNNNKRQRLNGKSGPRHSSAQRSEAAARNNSPLPLKPSGLPETISRDINNEKRGSRSSLVHHESHMTPSLPMDSGLLSIVKHQSSASNISRSQEELNDDHLLPEADHQYHQPDAPLSSPQSTISSTKNHTVTTFSPDGDIQQENLGRDEGPLSTVTPHSPISSNRDSSSPPAMMSSPHSSVSGDHWQPHSNVHDHTVSSGAIDNNRLDNDDVNDNRDYFQYREPYNHLRSPDRLPLRPPVSEHDDPFMGMEIPDTSLGLYGGSPQQSIKAENRHAPNSRVDTEGFYYPKHGASSSPYGHASIASAQRHQLPLLSNRSPGHSRDLDVYGPNLSESSDISGGESSLENSESPRINV